MSSLDELKAREARIKSISLWSGFAIALASFGVLILGMIVFISVTGVGQKRAFIITKSMRLGGMDYPPGSYIEITEETETSLCLKLSTGVSCYPSYSVFSRAPKTSTPSIYDFGGVAGLYVDGTSILLTVFVLSLSGFAVAFVSSVRLIRSSAMRKMRGEFVRAEAEQRIGSIVHGASVKLEHLGNRAKTVFSQMEVSLMGDFYSDSNREIRDFIASHKTRLSADTTPLSAFAAGIIQRAEEEYRQVENAHKLYQAAMSIYTDTSRQVNRVGSIPLIKELEYDYYGLTSEDLKSLLPLKRWGDFQDVVNSIIADLQRLKDLVVKYELHEEDYEESDEASAVESDEERAYRILGIPPTATDEQIKTLYKKLALIYHPDTNVVKDDARFKEIDWAYRLLKSQRSIS